MTTDDVVNPHAYDDEKWATAAVAVSMAIVGLWEAGATIDDVADAVATGLENADVPAGTLITVEVG